MPGTSIWPGCAVSVMILVIGVELFKESFAKTLDPTPVSFGWLTVVVLVASILVKLWMSHLNRTIGRRIDSDTLLATAADARNDVITTNVVLIAAVLTQVTGFARLDGLMGIAVSLFILYSGAMLVKDTIDPLLGSAPDPELVRHIEDKALSYPGVLGVHDLMIHDYGPGNRLVSFHVEMDANADVMYSHDVIDRIERDLLNQDDLVATIHFDPVIASDSHVAELRSFLQQEDLPACTLAPTSTICASCPGQTHTNVIFDCAVPAEYITEKQRRGAKLAAALRAAVERKSHAPPPALHRQNRNARQPFRRDTRNQIKTTQERGIIMDYNKAALALHSKYPGNIAGQSLAPENRDARAFTADTPAPPSPAEQDRREPFRCVQLHHEGQHRGRRHQRHGRARPRQHRPGCGHARHGRQVRAVQGVRRRGRVPALP